MSNYANQSGTGPDSSQQQMLCQATVAKRFDPPPTDDSPEWFVLKFIACIEFCVPAAVVAPVAFAAGAGGDAAYQKYSNPNGSVDWLEAGDMGIFSAITAVPRDWAVAAKIAWGWGTGTVGSSVSSGISGHGPGDSQTNQESGLMGAICSLSRGGWSAMCSTITNALQGSYDKSRNPGK
jgi:hypothetical protein